MKTLTHKQAKRLMAVTAATMMMAGTTVQTMVTVSAADEDTTNSAGDKSQGLAVTPDATNLDKATKSAKTAGVKVTESATKTRVVKASEAAAAKKEIEADYAKQVKAVKAATKKQTDATNAYNTAQSEYEAQVGKYANETPVISGSSHGVTMNVYGDYDESKVGSYGYYGNFESVVDMSQADGDAVALSKAGWLSDSKLSIESAKDTKFYTADEVNAVNATYSATDNNQFIKNPKKGDVYRLSNAAINAITGDKYDLIISPTADWPTSPDSFMGLHKGGGNSLVVDTDGSTGNRLSYYFVPAGKAANTKNAQTVIMNFVSSDIDSLQGGTTNMGNIGILNPKNSGVHTETNANGETNYYDTTNAVLSDSLDTPRGTIGIFGAGSVFTWDFYHNHTDQSMKSLNSGQYRYNLLGTGSTLSAAIKPAKPVDQKVTIQKTNLIVTPEVTKDVDAGTNKGNVEGSADGQTFMKGDKMTYSLDASALPAGRDTYKSLAFTDELPDGFKYTDAKAFDKDGKDVSDQFTFSQKDGKFSATMTDAALKSINAATESDTALPTIVIYGEATQDKVTLENEYQLVVDGQPFESNKVTTPVTDIQAHKDVKAGVVDTLTNTSIDGKAVVKGQALTYTLSMDDLPANRATDIKSVVWSDTLPKYVDYAGYKVFNAQGEDVTDNYEYAGDNAREFVLKAKSTDAMNADKTHAYVGDHVVIYTNANEDGVNFKNTAKLSLNGQDKQTNTVKNSTPNYHPEKLDLTKDGKDNAGKSVKAGDTLHYQVKGDLSELQNLALPKEQLEADAVLTLSDDYDESKVEVNEDVQKAFTITLADDKDVSETSKTESADASSNTSTDDSETSSANSDTSATSESAENTTDTSNADTTASEADSDTNTIVIGKGTATKFDMNDVNVTWDLKNGRWSVTPKDNLTFLQKYAGKTLIASFEPIVKDGATGIIENTATQTTFGQDKDTNTVKNPIKESTTVEKETNVKEKTTKEAEETTEAPEKQLPNTGSNGPLQRIVNWFMSLSK